MTRRLPLSAWIGLAVMAISEAAMLATIEPFWSWHTPIAWTGYILFVDGLVWRRRASSLLRDNRAEALFIAIVGIPLWVVFEYYNKSHAAELVLHRPARGAAGALRRLRLGIRDNHARIDGNGGTRRLVTRSARTRVSAGISAPRAAWKEWRDQHDRGRRHAGDSDHLSVDLGCRAGVARVHLSSRSTQRGRGRRIDPRRSSKPSIAAD